MWFISRFLWILFVYTFSSWIYVSIVKLNYNLEYLGNWLTVKNEPSVKTYDYIIVGAGSAGCVLAARLSENASVLLIEAGGKPLALYDIPLTAPMLQLTPYNWQYKTEPQDNACLGLVDRRSVWPRGKILGGTGRLNYMVYLRGHPADFDGWQSNVSDHWSRDEIAGYFKRSEKQIGSFVNDSKYHSTKGPLPVSDLQYASGLVQGLLGASRELGLGVGDLNGAAGGFGFMETQASCQNGARYSSDYMLSGRDNITILLHTHVTKVLLRENYEAYGVRCERHGHHFTIEARREVILSAGTIGTPQILMLSGIGPARHLRRHKIKVAVDLPVGDNLQDHVSTGVDLVITNQSSPISWKTVVNPLSPLQYLFGKGPMTHPGCEVVGLVHANLDEQADRPPDLLYMALPGGLSSDAGVVLKMAMGIDDKLFRDYFAELVGTPVATLLPTVSHPHSRGCLRLRSSNYRDAPIINPRYLSHPQDVEVLIKGLELLVKLTETKAMAAIGGRVYTKPLPPCAHHEFASYSYWECYVRHLTLTTYHPVGTCKMGLNSDPTTVVDHTLRVHRTSRLRVVDASVMPTLPSANTNAVVTMIAEKAADLIISDWEQRKDIPCCTEDSPYPKTAYGDFQLT
ncbi:glucose dehydrogenase [FAD, quinone]-like [Homalodisca vitripennis]|uniref:glucose dehydrogenase [FAD, quinone]-like n=1 Tax=Homalodisca vitripennis TaxID=197043 RepID=UPI001EEA11D0|nr:glucose dehydrogenase [FAD, quinone]-like [Homalodisca vitripennis]